MKRKDKDVEALRAEVESVTCKLMDAITRADKLAEALRRYGVHDETCTAMDIPICTCGLDAALEQEALLRQALEALERGAWDTLSGRNAAVAIRGRLGLGQEDHND